MTSQLLNVDFKDEVSLWLATSRRRSHVRERAVPAALSPVCGGSSGSTARGPPEVTRGHADARGVTWHGKERSADTRRVANDVWRLVSVRGARRQGHVQHNSMSAKCPVDAGGTWGSRAWGVKKGEPRTFWNQITATAVRPVNVLKMLPFTFCDFHPNKENREQTLGDVNGKGHGELQKPGAEATSLGGASAGRALGCCDPGVSPPARPRGPSSVRHRHPVLTPKAGFWV